MKNKIAKLCMVLFAFLMVGNIHAQKVKVKLSPEYKLSKKKFLAGHLHSDETGHYMYFREQVGGLFSREVEYSIEKYDNKFKKIFTKSYQVDRKDVYGVEMKYFKGKFAWLQYEKDFGNDDLNFYITEIDLDGKGSKPKKIASFEYKRRTDFPKTSWEVSQDTSRILFIAQDDIDRRREDYSTFITVLDNDFNKLHSKMIKLPYSQRQVVASSFTVSNEGDVYFLAKIYENNSRRESKKGKAAYDMKLYKIAADGSKKSYDLKLDDSFIKGMKIKLVETQNQLALIGFTGDSRKGPIQGVTFMKMSTEDGEINFAKKRNFTSRELDSFGKKNTSKDRKSREVGLDDEFQFNEIVVAEDGSITAITEENYVKIRTYTDSNGNVSYRSTFYNNALVIMDINPDGIVENVGMIPKRQTNTKSGYPKNDPKAEIVTDFQYYFSINIDGQFYYLYNDDKDNFRRNITDPDKYKVISSYNDAIAVLAHFDENGKLQKQELFGKKEAGTLLMPKFCAQISDNEVFFFNKKSKFFGKNDFRFGILLIE